MRGWVTALRIARREAWRAKGRSALVVALIGLPVCALSFAAVTYDSFRLTPEQEVERQLGNADALVRGPFDAPLEQSPDGNTWRPVGEHEGGPPPEVDVETLLPAHLPGARTVPLPTTDVTMRTATGIADIRVERRDLADPIHNGHITLREGRTPAGSDEVALTRKASDRLGAGIGDEIAPAEGGQRWTVVGLVEYGQGFRTGMVLPPEPAGSGYRPTDVAGDPVSPQPRQWLVATGDPVTLEQVNALNRHGMVVVSRHLRLHPPAPSEVDIHQQGTSSANGEAIAVGAVAAALVLVEVVLLAGPAFAVGARRRQRDLALVAANGGSAAHQRRIVLADGVVLGLAGAAAGIALGVATALSTLPLLEEYLMNRRAGGVRVFPLALAGVAALAVLTGLAAALVPAAVAARQPVVAGLSGRRGTVRSNRRWLVLGLVAVAAGAGLAGAGAWRIETTLVLAGLVLAQLGLVLCTPALVGLVSRAGRLLPLTPRIALRDTARNRAAAAPAISAVMAAVTAALAFGLYMSAQEQRQHDSYQAGLPPGHVALPYDAWEEDEPTAEERDQMRAALRQTLPVEEIHEVSQPACPVEPAADDPDGCWAEVPVPEERRCPGERMLAERREAGDYDPLPAEVQQELRQDPRCQEVQRGWSVYLNRTVVADGDLLPALIGGDGDELATAAATLRDGGLVVTDPDLVVDGQATVATHRGARGEPESLATLPAHAVTTGERVPFAILSPGALDRTGLATEPYGLVVATSRMPTQAEEDQLRAALDEVRPELGRRYQLEQGEHPFDEEPFLLVFTAVAGVVALLAAGIATGLAAADRRGDLATLGAVGASPRVRRLLSLSQAGVIAGLGGLLGCLAGVGSALAVLVALNQAEAQVWPVLDPPYPLTVPWLALGFLLLAVPAVAMAGAGLLTRSRLPVERRVG